MPSRWLLPGVWLMPRMSAMRVAAARMSVRRAMGSAAGVAKVYRLEGDKVRILVRDVRRLLKLYKISAAQTEAVLELARQARLKDWWHQYSGAIPEWFQFYVGLEAAVSAMHGYDSELVPGLLQTEQYVRAIMSTAPARDNSDEIERQITVRMEPVDPDVVYVEAKTGALCEFRPRVREAGAQIHGPDPRHLAQEQLQRQQRRRLRPGRGRLHGRHRTG